MKTLWIVSGGSEAVPGIRRAKELGLHVVVSDRDPSAPGFALADGRVLASTYDVGATVRAAIEYHRRVRPVHGVICMAADVPLTVASVADALGLPGIPVGAAQLATDKFAMKRCFADAGVSVPWFSAVESPAALRALVAERGLPLVLKPVDGRGARGVLRLTSGVDLPWAFEYAMGQSPGGRVMVEEYLAGPQISTESLLVDGLGATPGFVDRNYEHLERFAPHIVENGGEQPSRLDAATQAALAALAVRAARAMGITTGVAKGDLVLTERGPCVIEIAARLSGGWMATDQVPLATGVDLVGAAIRVALGETVPLSELTPRRNDGVAIRYFFPEAGRVTAIDGAESVRSLAWVHRLHFFVQPGDTVEPVTDHPKRAGFVIASGATRDEAVARAVEVVDRVAIRTTRG